MAKGVTKLPSGRFRARVFFSGRDIAIGTYDTEAEAERAVMHLREQLTAQNIPHHKTLAGYGTQWLERRERSGLVRGIDTERSRWLAHIESAPFANEPLKSITKKRVNVWIRDLAYEGKKVRAQRVKVDGEWRKELIETDASLSRQTVVHILNLLRACLFDAVDEGLIDENPAANIRVPRRQDSAQKWTWLRPHEIELCESHPDDKARIVWTVAIYTGLRKGELAGLTWESVRFDEDRLVITRSYERATKNGRWREVPLLPPAKMALKEWQQLRPGLPAAPLWCSASGSFIRATSADNWKPGSWDKRFPRMFGRRVRFHDLRHTCASHLVQGTWGKALSLYEVAHWLGHSDAQMATRYAHLAPEGIHGVAATMAEEWTEQSDRGVSASSDTSPTRPTRRLAPGDKKR